VDQTVTGLDPLNSAKGQTRIIIAPGPADAGVYTLDPITRTANLGLRFMLDHTIGGGGTYALPLGGPRWASLTFNRREDLWRDLGATVEEQSLGRRQVSGVDVVGRRVVTTVPAGVVQNDRPFQIVDDRWESSELGILIHGVSSDPRTGDIEYRLTNIRRTEPSADLFAIPSDYTIATTGDNGWTSTVYAERHGQATKRW